MARGADIRVIATRQKWKIFDILPRSSDTMGEILDKNCGSYSCFYSYSNSYYTTEKSGLLK